MKESFFSTQPVPEGKNKMLVLNAIRLQRPKQNFAVINRQTPFVITKKICGVILWIFFIECAIVEKLNNRYKSVR